MAHNHEFVICPGAPALSKFRQGRLASELRKLGLQVADIQAHYFHLALFADNSDDEQRERLHDLLETTDQRLPDSVDFIVVPRLGTVSPWSSKAQDIARSCGITQLQRLERGVLYSFPGAQFNSQEQGQVGKLLHDPMTESLLPTLDDAAQLFATQSPRPLRRVPLLEQGTQALAEANQDWGLALSESEIEYLADNYRTLERNPSDAELMMFAQINSEHCRHKIFNAEWHIDGVKQPLSLFDMIRASHAATPEGVLSAYKDNAAVIDGPQAERFFAQPDRSYKMVSEAVPILMKVETHNHPTAIAPNPGAATGAGGEIRDEAATGRGGRPKASLCGFSVSNLRIPDFIQPWEVDYGRPERVASPLQIMLEGPIGAASYNNEFGRPNLAGYFRSYEQKSAADELRGYHKPIMIAGGMGNVRPMHVEKQVVQAEACLVVLGGPAMLIGLGGGAASSMASGESSEQLDFASVQRANPELERRCQEVIDACWALGEDNPIASAHDVGAGGLSNALPEIIDADGRGGQIRLRDIQSADASLSPMEIWCNESQERYVLAINADKLIAFEAFCARERCPYAVVGRATLEPLLMISDGGKDDAPVNMPMPVLLGKTPKMQRSGVSTRPSVTPIEFSGLSFADAATRVLRLPSVASKSFLITIGDRSVGGQVARDQMVGPWQVPVADVAVTTTDFTSSTGEAMAMGERAPLAVLDAPASGRMAVAEAITNIAAARIQKLSDVRLSANWMAACGDEAEDARLFETVKTVGAEICPALGLAIPVGKDSLSMQTLWQVDGEQRRMTAPLSLIVSAFAPVTDAAATLTSQLRLDAGETVLVLIDLGVGKNRLGGSALAQVSNQTGGQVPDLEQPERLKSFFNEIQRLSDEQRLLAYHDRSDGGLFATLCEMAFAGHAGFHVDLSSLGDDALSVVFNEELGAVIQIEADQAHAIIEQLQAQGLSAHELGRVNDSQVLQLDYQGETLLRETRADLHAIWAETSYRMAALRDEPGCAAQEFASLKDEQDPGLPANPSFDINEDPAAPYLNLHRPRVAILREQGVNGHIEMAWSFAHAGFDAVDVHMSELLSGQVSLEQFQGLAACGGFSYGDVLGAGQGWAKSILFHDETRAQFAQFLAREDRFALGVCNGCQMFSALREIIPGTEHWPRFVRNISEQFEARLVAVEIPENPSLFLQGMAGSQLPIVVAHGEGRAEFGQAQDQARLQADKQIAMRYIDNYASTTQSYPFNPNGSPAGITAVSNNDGRVLAMMPHPERVTRNATLSWHPQGWGERSPWARLFSNARAWVG